MDWHLTLRLVVIAIALVYLVGPLIGEWHSRSI